MAAVDFFALPTATTTDPGLLSAADKAKVDGIEPGATANRSDAATDALLADKLDAADPSVTNSRTPTGAAGGDLSGTYPNPDVAKVKGHAVPSGGTTGQSLRLASDGTFEWYTPGEGGGSLTVREQDGSPSVTATTIEFATGTTVADQGSGVVRVTPPAGGGSGFVSPMTAVGDIIYLAPVQNEALTSRGATFSTNGGYFATAGGECDANDSTYGFSNTSANAGSWFRQDLGSSKTIGAWRFVQTRLDSSNYRATAVKLQSSADGSTGWTDLDTITGIPFIAYDSGLRTLSAEVTGRYFRVLATAGGVNGWCVNTIELTSTPTPAKLAIGATGDYLMTSSAGLPAWAKGGGTTANRPASPALYQHYFDTTIGKPIWWNGTNWKDATSTTV